MARRGLNKPIVSRGAQIVGGGNTTNNQGSSMCTPGENNGELGELVHVNNTIAVDWIGTRYFAIDYDGGSDEAVGFSDTSMADSGTKALKTIEELLTRLPKLGQSQRAVIAIKTRAGGATYLKKDGVTPDRLNLNGQYGYFHLLVRGTGTNTTAGAVAFANDTADKIYLGAQLVSGTAAAYTTTGVNTVETITVTPGGLAAEPALIGKRIRFDSATTTVALRNFSAMIHANTANTITVADNLPAVPVATDVLYIEEPGVAVDTIAIRAAIGNAQDEVPSFSVQGIHVAGIRTTNATQSGTGAVINGSAATILSFCECMSTGATSYSINNFFDVRLQRSYVDEAGVTVITGVGVRCVGLINVARGIRLVVSSSAATGALGRAQVLDIVTNSIGAGSYLFAGVLLQGSGNGANVVGGVFANLIGRANSTTTRRLRVLSAIGAPLAGLSISFGDVTIYGVDITGQGTASCIILRGVSAGWSVNDVVGSTGNTGAGLSLQVSKNSHIAMGTLAANTFTGASGRDIEGSLGILGPYYVHADYTRTDLKDDDNNHIIGSGNAIMGTCALATGNAIADIGQYKIVRYTSSNAIQAAQADTATNAVAMGVTQSPATAAGTQNTMVVEAGGSWVQFDAAPTVPNIAYLSTTIAGNAQDTIPVVAGTNQKVRLGRVMAVSGTLGFIRFQADILAVLADGLA